MLNWDITAFREATHIMADPGQDKGPREWRALGYGIYAFDDHSKGVPDQQDSGNCTSGLKAVIDFADTENLVKCSTAAGALMESSERDDVKALWLGEYGCVALFFKSLGSAVREAYNVYLVGLDKWHFDVNCSAAEGPRWTSASEDFVEVSVGSLPVSQHADFLDCFRSVLDKIQSEGKGDNRSAARNEQGHQRTPAFIWAVMTDVLAALASGLHPDLASGATKTRKTAPPGGLTDVGLHTGGKARSTCWPLVRAAVEAAMLHLEGEGAYGPDLWHHFDVWFMENYVASLTSKELAAYDVNAVMRVLQGAVKGLAGLSDMGHDVSRLHHRCEAIKAKLVSLDRKDEEATAQHYTLQDYAAARPMLRDVTINSLPDASAAPVNGTSLEEARELASKNLGDVKLPPSNFKTASAATIHSWLSAEKWETSEGRQLVLTTVEQWAYAAMARLQPLPNGPTSNASIGAGDEDVVSVLDLYLETLRVFREAEGGEEAKARVLVELRSREMLVVWVIFCLVHHDCKTSYSALAAMFGLPIRWGDLRHLCLEDREAWEAVGRVRGYLEANTVEGSELFQLSKPAPTLRFAEAFARQDAGMRKVLKLEKKGSEDRKVAYWAEVKAKKELVARLRQELAALEQKHVTLIRKLANLRQQLHSNLHTDPAAGRKEEGERQRRINSSVALQSLKRSELAVAQKAPNPVFQSLPEKEGLAYSVIFMATMTPKLRLLARLSVLSQQMLLPTTFQRTQVLAGIAVCNPSAHVPKYVTTKAACERLQCPPDLSIILGNTSTCVPDHVGPWGVDEITDEHHNIWHPDALLNESTVCLLWNSDGSHEGAYFNPFRLQDDGVFAKLISQDFTARLPEGLGGMQWAMRQPGTQRVAAARSNEALARPDKQPSWLNKPQYLAFASLRAYPLLQLSRLTGALLDHSLPLGHAAVRLLLQQTLYQLGDLCPSSAGCGGLAWKREWLDEGSSGLKGLHVALAGLADQLRNTPRESDALRTVAHIASFASQWRPDIRVTVCRVLAEAARRFAHTCEAQIEAVATQSALVSALRTRQCRFYLLGLLCHTCHTEEGLGQEDAMDMCRLMVQANHARIFEQKSAEQDEVRELTVLATHSLARVIGRLTSIVDAQPSCLTRLAGLVVQGLSEGLEWRRLGEQSACYEAVGEQGLCSVNLLTGVVLLNGLPPRRLPATVIDHPLYKRVFRGRDFETVLSGGQGMRTVRAVNGAVYEFHDDTAQKRLVVREVMTEAIDDDDDGGVTLELLDRRGEWCKDLPLRLRELHGHWYWRDKGIIFLRGVSFLNRSVSFILVDTGGGIWRCLRVPSHLREAGVSAIHQAYKQALQSEEGGGFDRLGHLTTHPEVSRVFERLEDAAFIHYFAKEGPSLALSKVFLPRLGLEYELRDDGRFWSSDFGGDFHMSKQQHLTDTLRRYKGYLLLEHRTTGVVKLIAPRGPVERKQESGHVSVLLGRNTPSQTRDVHYYDVHTRLLNLRSPTISAHLHLACLYAACSTRLPEPRRLMTGAQVALELVRQCFLTRPLHAVDELPSVRLLQASLSHTCPALRLLASELERSSMQHAPLYADPGCSDGDDETVGPAATSLPDPSAVTAYLCHDVHLRASLTPEEETRLLGRRRHDRPSSSGRVMPLDGSIEVNEQDCHVPFNAVESHEAGLMGLLRFDPPSDMAAGLPLNTELLNVTKLGQQMVGQLEKSLLAYQAMPTPSLVLSLKTTATRLRTRAKQVTQQRRQVERFVLEGLTALPGKDKTSDWHSVGFALLRLGELQPSPCLYDLMYLALDELHARRLNPFLSQQAREALQRCSVLWLSLCVLEDQLQRLCQHCDAQDEAALKQELQAKRNWTAHERVQWLVYEVENRLKIRPMQATVAELLVQNIKQQEEGKTHTGKVVQMNMGEGKTRVILPLLLLHPQRGKRLLRLHFLSQLLGDALEHLHAQLCRSVLHRKLGVLPFHRQTCLSPNQARVLCASLAYLQRSGGALCIAPEHRLSMGLKILELRQQAKNSTEPSELGEGLESLLDDVDYVDVLDECDELLRHKYQLIYAVGSKQALPSGHLRWHAVQALCRTIKTYGRDKRTELGRLLADPQVAVWEGGQRAIEAFPKLRLARGQALENVKQQLTLALAKQLLKDPPYEFEWLARDEWVVSHRQRVLHWVSERRAEVDEEMEAALGGEGSSRVQALLGLRGLLAFGLLLHVLQMRHRVDYGIKEDGPKSLAVPYRAADTPAERAEYSQADVSLCCTMLSHYYDGLSETQTLQTFAALLQHGRSAQADLYESWLRLSRPSMSDDDCASVDSALKLDLSNALQRQLLVRHFCRNMETVNLYLAQLVLPRETPQFPQRLVANAWHLCANPIRPIGFSGTDDNNLLLPLQVQPLDTHADEGLRQLAATNGRMLCLLEANPEVALLAEGSERPLWRRVLDEAVTRGVDALIDAGGLVAGISYDQAAHYALTHQQRRHKAVVFWDQATHEWAVVDDKGRRWALGGSPIRERDALVLFDDSHCRGADMVLAPTARALLTLGPRMQKDKLMQAAGRMRRLHSGQSVVLLATHDVARQVRTANGYPPSDTRPLTTSHVLQWATGNSVAANREGLAEFAKQGLVFAHTFGAADGALFDEVLRLRDLYGATLAEEPLADFLRRLQDGWATKRGALSPEMRQLEKRLRAHVNAYGGDCLVSATGLDEECERELELEVEQEEETEVQLPRMHPRAEKDWAYKQVLDICQEAWLRVGPYDNRDGKALVAPLGALLAAHVKATQPGEDLSSIQWWSKIHATQNFLLTVQDESGGTPASLAEYLRPVSSFLRFKADGSVLLLSEREADAIQAIIHDQPPQGPALPYELLDLTTCRLARADPLTFDRLGRAGSHAALSVDALVSLQLLDGETTFKSAQQKKALKRAVGANAQLGPDAMDTDADSGGGRRAALSLPRLRGKHGDILRSDLERACM